MIINIYKKLIKNKNKKIFFKIYFFIFLLTPIYLFFSGNYKFFEINNFITMHERMIFNLTQSQSTIILVFFLFNIFWTFFIGLNTPLNIIAGFLFGNLKGLLIILFSSTLGSILFYSFFSYLTASQIRNFIPKKYKSILKNLKKNEIFYFSILRLTFFLPQILCNFLPLITRMKILTFSIITFFMSIPLRVLTVNIGDKMFLQYTSKNFYNNSLEIKFVYSIIIFMIFLLVVYSFQGKLLKLNNISKPIKMIKHK